MHVMIFGASCSPYAAHFVKNTNAMQFNNEKPRRVTEICDSHYVYEWINNFPTEESACAIVKEVLRMLWALLDLLYETVNLNNNANLEGLKLWVCSRTHILTHFILQSDFIELRGFFDGKLKSIKTRCFENDDVWYWKCSCKICIWRSAIDLDQLINDEEHTKRMKWVKYLPIVKRVQVPRLLFRLMLNVHLCQLNYSISVDSTLWITSSHESRPLYIMVGSSKQQILLTGGCYEIARTHIHIII